MPQVPPLSPPSPASPAASQRNIRPIGEPPTPSRKIRPINEPLLSPNAQGVGSTSQEDDGSIADIAGGTWYIEEPYMFSCFDIPYVEIRCHVPEILSCFKPHSPELPTWACNSEVAALSRSNFDSGPVPLGCTCGPAVKYAFLATANLFALWALVPILTYFLSSCPDDILDIHGQGFANCDDVFLYGLFVFVTLPIQLFLQYRCMSYVIVPQLAVTKRFDLFGNIHMNRFHYHVVLLVFSGFAFLGLLDTVTNGEVLGRVLYTAAHCPAASAPLELRWQETMYHSIISKIPGLWGFQYSHVCLTAYLLQLAAPLFALAYSVPLPAKVLRTASYNAKKWQSLSGMHGNATLKRWPDYVVGADSDSKHYKFQYHTLYNRCNLTNHGAVVQVLASLSRMEAINSADLTFAAMKMKALEEKKKKSETQHRWELDYLNLARVECDRGVARFLIIGCIQNCLQTNLQVSIVGLSYAVSGALDRMMLFSIMCCTFGILSDFPDMIDIFCFVWKGYRPFAPYVDALDKESKRVFKLIRWRLLWFTIYICLYLWITLWSLAKFVALFACKHHLWNADVNFMEGCA